MVMKGDIKPIAFLEGPPPPTPTPGQGEESQVTPSESTPPVTEQAPSSDRTVREILEGTMIAPIAGLLGITLFILLLIRRKE